MSEPEVLSRGDRGPAVEALQRLLNRRGALLTLDARFGRATEAELADAQRAAGLPASGRTDAETRQMLAQQPEPSVDIATEAVTFIVRHEVGSRRYYETHTAQPHFPGGHSGVTIGIGYDLRFEPEWFAEDWGSVLPPETTRTLERYLGRPGSRQAVESLAEIRVPWRVAWGVFVGSVLPRYVARTRRAFPGFDAVSRTRRGVLVSLVYNRGSAMLGESRREMREIRAHVARGELAAVPDALRAMRRLWPDARGLRLRREQEADLWLTDGAGTARSSLRSESDPRGAPAR